MATRRRPRRRRLNRSAVSPKPWTSRSRIPAGRPRGRVVYKGQIVASGTWRHHEGHAARAGRWARARDVFSSSSGRRITVDQAAPVPDWQKPATRAPRPQRDLLHRARLRVTGTGSGLHPERLSRSHLILHGRHDAFTHSMTRPLSSRQTPKPFYRNSDPLMIGWLQQRSPARRGLITYPQRAG